MYPGILRSSIGPACLSLSLCCCRPGGTDVGSDAGEMMFDRPDATVPTRDAMLERPDAGDEQIDSSLPLPDGGSAPDATTIPEKLEPLTVEPQSGTYNIASAFRCAVISGLMPDSLIRYELTTDGSEPKTPSASSPRLSTSELCGIAQNGKTIAVVRQFRGSEAGPTTRVVYDLDTKPPVIISVAHDATSTMYPDSVVHFSVKLGEPDAQVHVSFVNDEEILLSNDGTHGDAVAQDGSYELDYSIGDRDHRSAATVTARAFDKAGNPSAPAFASTPLNVDTIGTLVGGKPFFDSAVWNAAGNPYMIDANAVFDSGASLVIRPGVHLVFRNHAKLEVRDQVALVGTPDSPITVQGEGTLNIIPVLPTGERTYDDEGLYARGPHLEHLIAPDLTVSALDNFRVGQAAVYVAHSHLRGVVAYFPTDTWGTAGLGGSYIGHSRIGYVGHTLDLGYARHIFMPAARMEHSYFDRIMLALLHWDAGLSLRHCKVGTLELRRGDPDTVISDNILGTVRWTTPSDTPALHANDFSPAPGKMAMIIEGTDSDSQDVNASGNYWGMAATAQMQELGPKADIDIIEDFFENFDVRRVLYDGWVSAPISDAGPDW